MRVLGIDPGLERVGFGVIDRQGSRLIPVEFGVITTPRIELCDRLTQIHKEVGELLERTRPSAFALERLYFAKNQTTAMDVARASGVILLAAAERGLVAQEYSPPQVKKGVVGNGAADKKQVGFMVTRLLGLKETPKPDDAADALALAIACALGARAAA